MKTKTLSPTTTETGAKKPRAKIFGVGTAGGAMLAQMATDGFERATFVAVNADATGSPPLAGVETIQLETRLLRGMGTGGDPERGQKVADENLPRLKEACAGAEVIFILAGLGGGAGTGISPVLARVAREAGALTLAFVTLPFDCEGNRRQHQARQGLAELQAVADGVICLPDQRVFKLIDENTSLVDTFRTTAQLLVEGARGVWRLLMHRGLIEIHFAELSALLRDCQGDSCFAAVEVAGATRARDAMKKLLAHPLLDGGEGLKEADAVLVSLMGGPDLTMADVNRVMEQMNQHCQRAQVIMGAAVDEAFGDRLTVTVIATRRAARDLRARGAKNPAEAALMKEEPPELETQFMERKATARSASRFVPPAPALTPEQREQLLTKQGGGRARKSLPRMRQGHLPLNIVNRGRFDKTEPTVHKGEDLDVPTYIRRGVALN